MYLKGVTFHYVDNVKEVWNLVLTDELVENHQVFEIDNTEENKEK